MAQDVGENEMTKLHVSYSVTDDCINHSSCGAICVWCNCCGRVDKKTMKDAQLKHFKELLEEQYNFDGWIEGMEETQKANVKENIKYFKSKIEQLL